MLHFQFINRKRRKIAHENQLSDQFSKSIVIGARLQNAMGLLSLLIALSLQLKWVKIGNNYHFLTEKKKPLLRLKWCSHVKILAFFSFTLPDMSNLTVQQDTYGEISWMTFYKFQSRIDSFKWRSFYWQRFVSLRSVNYWIIVHKIFLRTVNHICIFVENSPNASGVYIRLRKHSTVNQFLFYKKMLSKIRIFLA